jgi:hypothetical protein
VGGEENQMSFLRVGLLIVLILFVVTLIPYEREALPKYEVTVEDIRGGSLANVQLQEFVQDYSSKVDNEYSRDVMTNGQGRADFEGKTIRASLAQRAIACLRQIAAVGAHASCGVYADITVSDGHLVERARTDQRLKGRVGEHSLKLTMEQCPSSDQMKCTFSGEFQ